MQHKGLLIAIIIILLWASCLYFLLFEYSLDWRSPFTYIFLLVQTHLYTGLFITAHDAMHHTVSSNSSVNHRIGFWCALLFAYNYYPRLIKKHHEHHRFVATDKDPDYHHGNFLVWYYNFGKNYITIWQIIAMAITFNLLKLFLPVENVILYWMLPSVLATFQLFYFGTYLPHRYAPDNKHRSRSQKKNHFWAFISCYFFGYHYEHHDSPATPWWKLHEIKK